MIAFQKVLEKMTLKLRNKAMPMKRNIEKR